MTHCSIGIMAYNEEKNIGRLLSVLSKWRSRRVIINNIYVVASGCTDDTVSIVQKFVAENPKIILLKQKKRQGKASAINLWLRKTTEEKILILISADTLPLKDSLEKLVLPFKNPTIGMTGGRPRPINSSTDFMGFAVNFLWNMHHLVALDSPKLGEVIAFRNLVKSIPPQSAVDEASIEKQLIKLGYKIKYIPKAIIYNKGPENIKDFFKQRRRIYTGHLLLKEDGYAVSTLGGTKIFLLFLKNIRLEPKYLFFAILTIFIEIWSRILGYYDYKIKKKNPYIWETAESTKNLVVQND